MNETEDSLLEMYVEELENITLSEKPIQEMRMYDIKDSKNGCPYDFEDMVYMSDGMYIHKDDCWW